MINLYNPHKFRAWGSVSFIVIMVLLALTITLPIVGKVNDIKASYAENKINSYKTRVLTDLVEVNASLSATLKVLEEKKPTPTQAEIEDYIRSIFGKEARVAIAVSHNECNPKNKQYPKCVAHTDKEYSVGIFQINLYNKTHWIHANKVPGKTIEEKAEALKDPYINTLVAYKIYSDSKGFTPWSAFTNRSYKLNLKGGE